MVLFSSPSSDYGHNPALPGSCWQSGYGVCFELWDSAARALLGSLMLLFTACALCSALPCIYLVQMFPQPSPDYKTPAWLLLPRIIPVIIPDSPSLWLPSKPVLLPFPGTVPTKARDWECEFPWHSGSRECFAGMSKWNLCFTGGDSPVTAGLMSGPGLTCMQRFPTLCW